MKNKAARICLFVMCLVALGALQEMLPAFGGAKPPLLALLALYVSARPGSGGPRRSKSISKLARSESGRLAFVCAAGLFEDALCSFPPGCCLGFVILAHLAVRVVESFISIPHGIPPAAIGAVAATVFAPLRETWLSVWGVVGPNPSAFVRFFASALPAALAGAALFAALPRLEILAGAAVEGGSAE